MFTGALVSFFGLDVRATLWKGNGESNCSISKYVQDSYTLAGFHHNLYSTSEPRNLGTTAFVFYARLLVQLILLLFLFAWTV